MQEKMENADAPIDFESFAGMDLNNKFGDHKIIRVSPMNDDFLSIIIDLDGNGRENEIVIKKSKIKRDGDGFIAETNIGEYRIKPRSQESI